MVVGCVTFRKSSSATFGNRFLWQFLFRINAARVWKMHITCKYCLIVKSFQTTLQLHNWMKNTSPINMSQPFYKTPQRVNDYLKLFHYSHVFTNICISNIRLANLSSRNYNPKNNCQMIIFMHCHNVTQPVAINPTMPPRQLFYGNVTGKLARTKICAAIPSVFGWRAFTTALMNCLQKRQPYNYQPPFLHQKQVL